MLELGGRGTRNDIISTPVVYDNKVYFCTGQDPEHGEGIGILWCIDPTKRGDISEKLAVNRDDPEEADSASSGFRPWSKPTATWRSTIRIPAWSGSMRRNDANGDGKIDFEEQFHRSIGTVAIKNDLLFVPDFSGLFHCVDAKTGKVHWTYDMLAASWGSPLIVDDKVYVGDEDGDIAIFNLTQGKARPAGRDQHGQLGL